MDLKKAILFDLDDTLMVEWNSAMKAFRQTALQVNTGIDREAFVKAVTEEAKKHWYELPTIDYCVKMGISSWEALWANFEGAGQHLNMLSGLAHEYRIETWKRTLMRFNIGSDSLAEELAESFMQTRSCIHELYDDTLECLNKLDGKYSLGLITNGPPDVQRKKIKGGKLSHFFKTIVISAEYGFAKPDPRIFKKALLDLGCDPKEAIMIGDSLKNDVGGARDTGITSVWLNRNHKSNNYPDIIPDFEITKLKQLEGILKNFNNETEERFLP